MKLVVLNRIESFSFVANRPSLVRSCDIHGRKSTVEFLGYGSAPRYLAACCVPVSTTASRQHLRSVAGHQLVIPSHRLATYGCRAFSIAGPMFWNSLPRNLRDPSHTAAVFGWSLKHFFSQSTSVHSASEAFVTMHYINWCFTYSLTYLTKTAGLENDRQEWHTDRVEQFLGENIFISDWPHI